MSAIYTHNAFFEKSNTLFDAKTFKAISCLGWSSTPIALNLEKLGVKIYNFDLSLEFLALF